ncbi:MAG: DUF5668 domain-containing protein [Acidobacteriota bacterium]
MDTRDDHHHSYPGKIVGGLIVIIVGLVLLGDQTGFSEIRLSSHLWPMILVVLGVVKLSDSQPRHDGRRHAFRSGLWLVYLGFWGFVNEFHLFGLNYGTSWPLLVVGVGLLTVWRALERPDDRSAPVEERR